MIEDARKEEAEEKNDSFLQAMDRVGFGILPNGETCINGMDAMEKLVAMAPNSRINFLLNLWMWISSSMKKCI